MGQVQLHTYFTAQLNGLAGQGLLREGLSLALAVSGGPDSMALAQLAIDCARAHHPLHILTVDHGLRPEAAAEAEAVRAWAESLHLPCHVLTWQGGKDQDGTIKGNLHEQARLGRYALMAEWCAAHDVAVMMTGHHQDDQAETVLMRLARGSGVDGLGAMRGVQTLATAQGAQVVLLRPLLGVPKAALEQFAGQCDLPVVDDPSNREDKFLRSRHRAFLGGDTADGLGLTVQRLAQTARTMQRAADALDAATDKLLAAHVMASPLGYLSIPVKALVDQHEEMRFRMLRVLICAFSPGAFRVEEEQLQRLWHWLVGRGDDAPRYTIRGLLLEKSGTADHSSLLIMREPRAIAPAMRLDDTPRLWDGRFMVSGVADADQYCIPAAQLGISAVREGLPDPDQAQQFASAPPMARGTIPVRVAVKPESEPVILGLWTDQGQFTPHLTAKTPLILPPSQKIEPETGE